MRELIYIPTIHSNAEMGFPVDFPIEAREKTIWEEITSNLLSLGPNLAGKKLFAESVHIDFPIQINFEELSSHHVQELQSSRTKQSTLVGILERVGAKLCETEDVGLMRQSHAALDAILTQSGNNDFGAIQNMHSQFSEDPYLVVSRDLAIAKNIEKFLIDGDFGILVLGINHNVSQYLSKDINFRFLSPRLEAEWEVNKYLRDKEGQVLRDNLEISLGYQTRL